MAQTKANGNTRLQTELTARIRAIKADDPFARVSVVVDSSAQGWALRRQLVETWPLGTGVANLEVITAADLLNACAGALGLPTLSPVDDALRTIVMESVLRSQQGLLAGSKDHPETALLLGRLFAELSWCPLDDAGLERLTTVPVSSTSTEAAAFVIEARRALATALGESTWARLADDIVAEVQSGEDLDVGHLLVTCAWLPGPVARVLAALPSVERFAVDDDPDLSVATLLDCPDPATETRLAVRHAGQAIVDGVPATRIAILYSAERPYARLLEHDLDEAGLAWHGPSALGLETTTLYRSLDTLLLMAAERVAHGGSGITRPLLMRWFGLGALHDGSGTLPTGGIRAFIRQSGLYGDARNWRSGLVRVAAEADVELDDDPRARRLARLAQYATPLDVLIQRLDTALGAIVDAATWADLGDTVWQALEAFHPQQRGRPSSPDERTARQAIKAVLTDSLPRIDDFLSARDVPAMPPTTANLQQMLLRRLSGRRSRHGVSHVGVHVGPVASARLLAFDRVIVVGAADGLLPAARSLDPLLPEPARQALRTCPDDLPSVSEVEQEVARSLRGLMASASSVVATYPRGALPGRAVASVSRYFATSEVRPHRVDSFRSALTIDPPPVTTSDLTLRGHLGGDAPADLAAQVDAAAAWADPEFDRFFGNVGATDDGPAWSIVDRPLSASSIEGFLHCPYHFFVQRVLGIATDEFEDEIDVFEPKDMGTLLHRSFERLVDECRAAGTLPGYGEAWPDASLGRLAGILDEEARAAQDAGLTGWRPAWERSYRVATESLPEFLRLDATEVRGEPGMRPTEAEFTFGEPGTTEVTFRVTDDVVVRLRGSIDRLDLAEDPALVGVVDYKSGSADYFTKGLAIPGPRGGVSPRTKVQDLVYDVAARTLVPAAQEVRVTFFFVPNDGDPLVVHADHVDDREAALREILLQMDSAARTGAFIPKPGGRNDWCPVCKRLGRRAAKVATRGQELTEDDLLELLEEA